MQLWGSYSCDIHKTQISSTWVHLRMQDSSMCWMVWDVPVNKGFCVCPILSAWNLLVLGKQSPLKGSSLLSPLSPFTSPRGIWWPARAVCCPRPLRARCNSDVCQTRHCQDVAWVCTMHRKDDEELVLRNVLWADRPDAFVDTLLLLHKTLSPWLNVIRSKNL